MPVVLVMTIIKKKENKVMNNMKNVCCLNGRWLHEFL